MWNSLMQALINLASNDSGFERISGITVFKPSVFLGEAFHTV